MSIILLDRTEVIKLHGRQPHVVLQPLGGYRGQFFGNDNEIAGAWAQDGSEWHAEMETPWDDIVSDRYCPSKVSIFPVKIYQETVISFQVKTTFGPQHQDTYLSNPAVMAGGVFLFYTSSASGYLGDDPQISNITKLGGWHDWQTVTATLQAGNHFLYFDCTHAFLQSNPRWTDKNSISFDSLFWGPVPDGETATYQARVKDFSVSPGIMPYGMQITSYDTGGTADDPLEIDVANIDVTVIQPQVGTGILIALQTEGMDIETQDVSLKVGSVIPVANIALSSQNLGYRWSVLPENQGRYKTIFVCVLVMDGMEDLELPMASFSARVRNASPSYLSVIIPNILAYETDITAREDGEIQIKKGFLYPDGTRNLETIIAANFDYLGIDQGGRKASGTMVGYRQKTYGNGTERSVENITFRGVGTDGRIRLRGDVDLFIQPGDICEYGTDSFVVDLVSYFVSPRLAYMEVSE